MMPSGLAETIVAGDDILCFSHLRWTWVWQRPQHLLTQLAQQSGCRIFFIEEPLPRDEDTADEPRPSWRYEEVAPGITRCVPRCDAAWPFFLDDEGADTQA